MMKKLLIAWMVGILTLAMPLSAIAAVPGRAVTHRHIGQPIASSHALSSNGAVESVQSNTMTLVKWIKSKGKHYKDPGEDFYAYTKNVTLDGKASYIEFDYDAIYQTVAIMIGEQEDDNYVYLYFDAEEGVMEDYVYTEGWVNEGDELLSCVAKLDMGSFHPGSKLVFHRYDWEFDEDNENDDGHVVPTTPVSSEADNAKLNSVVQVLFREASKVLRNAHLSFYDLGLTSYDVSYEVEGTHKWNAGKVSGYVKTYTCTVCGAQKQSHAHKWNTKYTVDVPATCTEAGSKSLHCKDPNCTSTKSIKTIKALGHKWSKYTTTEKATVFAPGEKVKTCSRCAKESTAGIAVLKPTIKLSVTKKTMKVGAVYTLKVSKLANGDSVTSFTSSNEEAAVVDENGEITAAGKGKASIKVTLASGKTATCKVTVK